MPLPNTPQTDWNGYLIEGFAGQGESILNVLEQRINSHQLPKVTISKQKLNMWWRPDSPCLDIASQIDGNILCTVHVMDYGTSLFVGVAFAAITSLGNYYKRMAAAAFIETIDRYVVDAISKTAESLAQESPEVKVIGKVGKFGG